MPRRVVNVHHEQPAGQDGAQGGAAGNTLRDGIGEIWNELGITPSFPDEVEAAARQAAGDPRLPTLDRRIENLVFCGSNTQPGVGIPMVLLSGKLAAARITGEQP